ncbi:hypothetical protein FOPG_18333 [Fusarium oxysporum f. sp. conglutinans race 2 54008]|uniref:Uncharacterized protein n=1 Tax=Fusarium oxysporum f. sp. conglutinans race 2 54008 TaxID=1089457 RepID=X0HWB6_FUSOX|nr:hypothetical protein FOPG_18333 [Fusarium oxysporum f. sp. conglutinans race 2 54008]
MATSHSSATSTTPSHNGNGRVTSPDMMSCTSQAPVMTPPKRRPHRIYQPAKTSLSDIFQQHSGTALFERPICWTDYMLNCSILLPDSMHPILSSIAVKAAFMTLRPKAFSKPYYSPEFHLYFGGVVYRDAVPAQIMWNFPSDEMKSSYSSFSPKQLISPRMWPGEIMERARVSPPATQGSHARAFKFGSRCALRGHFFLGMAQKRFYPSPPITGRRDSRMSPEQGIPPCSNFHDLKLSILTHDTDTLEFIVYTGYVTKEFLENFHDPFKAPLNDDDAAVSGLKIEYTRVPIWPILGLRERLGKASGQEVVGSFNPDEIKTWEKEPEEQGGKKRK